MNVIPLAYERHEPAGIAHISEFASSIKSDEDPEAMRKFTQTSTFHEI
jgi:hypothetical protein